MVKNKGQQMKRGFTLLELLFVLLILGILVGVAMPRYIQSTKVAKQIAFESNLNDIIKALEEYKIQQQFQNFAYPSSLDVLKEKFVKEPINPYTNKSMLSNNPADSGIQYQIADNEYRICITQRDVDDVNDNGIVDEVLPLSTKTACIGNTQTSVGVTFARNSVAYTSNGAQVAANQPRFEQGKPDFGKAIMIEEGTTNKIETEGGGASQDWSKWSHWDLWPTKYWYTWEQYDDPVMGRVFKGTAKTETFLFDYFPYTVEAGVTYTLSVWLRASVERTQTIQGYMINPSNAIIGYQDKTITIKTTWQKFEWQITPNESRGVSAGIGIYFASGWDGVVIEAARPQLEQKPYATSFIDGTRAAETLTIPNANVFNKSNWNLEFQFNPASNQVVSNKTGYLWENYIDANNYYALKVGSDGKPYLEVKSNGTIYQTSTAAAPVLNVGTWYDIKIRGNGSLMAIAVNGTKISEVSYVEPVGNLPANMYIGSDHNGSNHANALFDDLRISAIARSDTEWTNAYTSGQPLPVDEWTTLKLDFNGDLSTQSGVIP